MSAARDVQPRLQPRLLTPDQAADYLQVSRKEIHRQGIGCIRLGIRVRYDRVALDAWVDAQREGGRTLAAHEDEKAPEAALQRIIERERHAARRS